MEIDTPARRVLALRTYSLSINDGAMVRECENQLQRWGISINEVENRAETPEKPVQEKRVPTVKKISAPATK